MLQLDIGTKELHEFLLSVLIYGVPKSGKTRLACMFPSPVVVLDTDGGLLSVASDKATYGGKVIKAVTLNPKTATFVQLEDAVKEVMAEGERAATVVVDSLTSITDIVLNHVRTKITGHVLSKPKTFTDWDATKELVQSLMFPFFNLPTHKVMIAHEDEREGPVPGQILILPMLIGDMRKKLPIYFDEVWHTKVVRGTDGEPLNIVETMASNVVCGSRLGILDDREATFDAFKALTLKRGLVPKFSDGFSKEPTKQKGGKQNTNS